MLKAFALLCMSLLPWAVLLLWIVRGVLAVCRVAYE